MQIEVAEDFCSKANRLTKLQAAFTVNIVLAQVFRLLLVSE